MSAPEPFSCRPGQIALIGGFVIFAALWGPSAFGQRGSRNADDGSSRQAGDGFGEGPRPVTRLPIFFPPSPPPLDRPVTRAVTPARGRLTPPAELARYVNEPFYAALGTRLFTSTLTEKLRQQLDGYAAIRRTLLQELHAELDRLRDAEDEARRPALETLARQQASRLAELGKTAEQLRHDLIVSQGSWGAHRDWHLTNRADRGFSPIEIAQVMRGYAFYEDGLLPAQRRLLREISIELMMAADDMATATAAQPHVFFPPEPARILLPEELPADLAAKVAAYQTKKSTLKKELYDAVSADDGATLGFLRGGLKPLAAKQAARLSELDTLAEELRRGLAAQAVAVQPVERSPLPASLTTRLNMLLRERENLQRETTNQIEALIARVRELPVQVSYSFEADGLRYVVVPRRARQDAAAAAQIAALTDQLRKDLATIADNFGRQVAQQINEGDAIYREAADVVGTKAQDVVDKALVAARRAAAQRENADAYRDYRTAVFTPGLSPEQRRLLFGSAVEKLELPLPRGELQPTRRATSW